MYSRENSRRKHLNEPSFSSTLLDEIYRSIDANADETEDSKFFYRDNSKSVKGQVDFRRNGNYSSSHRVDDEEMAGLNKRACLVEKWILKEDQKDNIFSRRHSLVAESGNKTFQDKDLVYFSSNSSSSDSSGALSSSSDNEFFSSSAKSRVSCFLSASRPKPVRTGGKNRQDDQELDDYKTGDDNLFKSKSRALKIYAGLRKVKQPISPGGRLSNFIHSLFSHANEKKSKNLGSDKGKDLKSMETSSNCSSASSFSRSCLSKNSREKTRNGTKKTVRFYPVSVIFNEEAKPCGSKSINCEDSKGFGRHSSVPNQLVDLKLRPLRVQNRKVEEGYTLNDNKTGDILYGFRKKSYSKVEEEEDDDDAVSDSSSDLFELDHLSLFRHSRFCEELPMYETTHYGTNRAIGSSF